MLVFMSDLHFVDGSAGDHNVKTSAFELVMRRIAHRAERVGAAAIEVVLLGDTIDLLRTEYWFRDDVTPNQTPWAVGEIDTPGLIAHTAAVSARIGRANIDTFSLFRDLKSFIRDEQETPVTEEVTVTYIPGNHDRLLCLDDERLMSPLLAQLGARLSPGASRFVYDNPDYLVRARHGHEYDAWNFEQAGEVEIETAALEDYLQPPIGDPITTELVTKLPYLVGKSLAGVADAPAVKARLQEIDNVRPLSSVLKWLFFQFKDDKAFVREAVEDGIDRVAASFREIPYVRQWFDKHDKFLRPDKADALQAVLAVADHLKITKAEALFKAVDLGGKLRSADPLAAAAETELLRMAKYGETRKFLVYGHSHEPKQIAMDVLETDAGRMEQVYLNTGTFRARHHEARRRGFSTWKQLTYVTLYTEKETAAAGGAAGAPTFESWTGAREV